VIKPGSFSIVPIEDYYIVRRGSWWSTTYVSRTFVTDEDGNIRLAYCWGKSLDSAAILGTVEKAKEAIKEAIIYTGICIKDKNRIKRIRQSRKTITVPPWNNP